MRYSTKNIAVQIRAAFAQFALFGFVPLPKPQTKSIIKPTNGMAATRIVITQSFTDMTGPFCSDIVAVLFG